MPKYAAHSFPSVVYLGQPIWADHSNTELSQIGSKSGYLGLETIPTAGIWVFEFSVHCLGFSVGSKGEAHLLLSVGFPFISLSPCWSIITKSYIIGVLCSAQTYVYCSKLGPLQNPT